MDIMEPIVLLVGNNMSRAFRLVEWLQSLGCEYHIAASYQEARTLLETHRFDVVLSETDLSDGNAYRLIASVRESPASLFFCLAVQDSYWWLPAVTQGRECLGAPALRPAEFARVLQEILFELTVAAVTPPPVLPRTGMTLSAGLHSAVAPSSTSVLFP